MPNPKMVLWIYILLLVAGGLMGLIKGKSKASLIMSTIFAVILALCAMGILTTPRLADYVLLFLFIFFASRFAKSKKFMPGGFMALLSMIALVLRNI